MLGSNAPGQAVALIPILFFTSSTIWCLCIVRNCQSNYLKTPSCFYLFISPFRCLTICTSIAQLLIAHGWRELICSVVFWAESKFNLTSTRFYLGQKSGKKHPSIPLQLKHTFASSSGFRNDFDSLFRTNFRNWTALSLKNIPWQIASLCRAGVWLLWRPHMLGNTYRLNGSSVDCLSFSNELLAMHENSSLNFHHPKFAQFNSWNQ